MPASYLGLFFFPPLFRVEGSTKGGKGIAEGKMERKRANKKRGGRGEQLYIIRGQQRLSAACS